jgi:hypothetical protein
VIEGKIPLNFDCNASKINLGVGSLLFGIGKGKMPKIALHSVRHSDTIPESSGERRGKWES